MRIGLRIAAILVLLFACAPPPAPSPTMNDASAASFDDGMRAHLKKHYGRSREIFLSLARAGNVRAKFMMGTIHEQGLGIPKNLAKAAAWYGKAGEGGNASALFNLGILNQFGKGVDKNPVRAASLLLRAANKGHGRAQNNLSTFYFTGIGVRRDVAEAWKWLTLSADGLKGSGREIALGNRSVIEKEMTEKERAEARRRVAAWRRDR